MAAPMGAACSPPCSMASPPEPFLLDQKRQRRAHSAGNLPFPSPPFPSPPKKNDLSSDNANTREAQGLALYFQNGLHASNSACCRLTPMSRSASSLRRNNWRRVRQRCRANLIHRLTSARSWRATAPIKNLACERICFCMKGMSARRTDRTDCDDIAAFIVIIAPLSFNRI